MKDRSQEIHPFQVGDFRCLAVSDGTMTYAPPMFPPPATFLCANAQREQVEQSQDIHVSQVRNWQSWTSSYNCLFVETGTHRVLVDTGANGLAPTTGKLIPNLKVAGVSPESVDLVILTHAHPDHVGGNTDAQGRPQFPKARWAMWRQEWEFWTTDEAEQKLSGHMADMLIGIARKNLLPIKDRLDLIDNEAEIIPGIKAVPVPGHTPGPMALDVSSRGQRLMCLSDLVLHPVHLVHPDWCVATDMMPADTAAARRSLLPGIAAEKSMVMAFHFPFPGLGYLEARGPAWDWKPI